VREALLVAALAACANQPAAPPDAPPPPPPDAAGVTVISLPFGPGSHGVHDAQVVGAVVRFTGTRGAEVGQVVLEGPKRWSFVPLPEEPEKPEPPAILAPLHPRRRVCGDFWGVEGGVATSDGRLRPFTGAGDALLARDMFYANGNHEFACDQRTLVVITPPSWHRPDWPAYAFRCDQTCSVPHALPVGLAHISATVGERQGVVVAAEVDHRIILWRLAPDGRLSGWGSIAPLPPHYVLLAIVEWDGDLWALSQDFPNDRVNLLRLPAPDLIP